MEPLNIDQALKDLASTDERKAYTARMLLSKAAAEAGKPANAELRKKLAAGLAKMLEAGTPDVKEGKYSLRRPDGGLLDKNEGRRDAAALLALVATDAEIPTLTKAMDDPDVREDVRFVLQQTPGEASTAALVAAAKDAIGPVFRMGAVAALASRTGRAVVEALTECVADVSTDLRVAACAALARHADASVDPVLAKVAEEFGNNRHGNEVTKARLRHATTLAKAGQKAAAKRVCEAVAGCSFCTEVQKKAAQRMAASMS